MNNFEKNINKSRNKVVLIQKGFACDFAVFSIFFLFVFYFFSNVYVSIWFLQILDFFFLLQKHFTDKILLTSSPLHTLS